MPKTMILYGESGTSKTSQIYHIAKYIYNKYGKRTRLIAADGGGYQPILEGGLIELGFVEVFDVTQISRPYLDLRRLGDGFWPRDGRFDGTDFCRTKPDEWKEIGVIAIEGITSIARILLNYASNYKDPAGNRMFKVPFTISEEEYETSGTDRGHYGVVQNILHELIVQQFNRLPVDYVIYTALVGRGESRVNRETIYGPKATGEALTAELPTWVGDCLHLSREVYQNQAGQKVETIACWYRNHPDPETNIPYLAKTRMVPEVYPEFCSMFPQGFVPLGVSQGIITYFSAVESLNEKIKAENKKKLGGKLNA